jgi:DNA N-6-adenine-methyltransferase (Dam)
MGMHFGTLLDGNLSHNVGGFGFKKPNAGETNDWLTPPDLLQRLGTFDLDPCGCFGMPWSTATTTYYLPEHDGLTDPWFGRVWCNPPYGPNVGDWSRRMAAHGNGMMLIFLRAETATWQQDILPFADAALLLEGRVHFYRPSGERGKSGTAPSALLAYGQNNVDALRNAGIAGALYPKAEMLVGVKASRF